jgi:hypothetical protein
MHFLVCPLPLLCIVVLMVGWYKNHREEEHEYCWSQKRGRRRVEPAIHTLGTLRADAESAAAAETALGKAGDDSSPFSSRPGG